MSKEWRDYHQESVDKEEAIDLRESQQELGDYISDRLSWLAEYLGKDWLEETTRAWLSVYKGDVVEYKSDVYNTLSKAIPHYTVLVYKKLIDDFKEELKTAKSKIKEK